MSPARKIRPPLLTIEQRIRAKLPELTPAERRAARAVLEAYPVAALGTIADIAQRAGVSAPSILRWVAKLGYEGFPQFQRAVRDEVQAKMHSPLSLLDATPRIDVRSEDFLHRFIGELAGTLAETDRLITEAALIAAVDLLCDPKRRIVTIGGRSSHVQAKYLAFHLNQLRAGVHEGSAGVVPLYYQAADLGRHDVVIAFDYRRYERATIEFCRTAARQGSTLVLITDPWLSPIADFTKHVLPVSVNVPSPFDTSIGAFALIEALLAYVLERLGPAARQRMQMLEDKTGSMKDGFVG